MSFRLFRSRVKFFFDNQLSPHLAAAINALAKPDGHDVKHLRDLFPPNTKDVEWIQKLSAEGGWIVVCGDLDIIRTRAEKPVWKSAGLIGFFLKRGWINMGPWDQAWRLVKWWPLIQMFAQGSAPGSTFGVPINPGNKLETL